MRPPPFHRCGFTLIELLVACFVLGTGVLALASTSVAVARLTGDAARAGIAAERGQAHMEGMRAARCSAASGSVVASGISEWWTAMSAATGQALSDSVRYIEGAHHDLRTRTLSSAAWCP
jgi:prepilin-type N-terminal cleavage/methylation domain-containing protein